MPNFSQRSVLLRNILEPLYLHAAIKQIKPDLIHVHYASRGGSVIPLLRFHPLVVTAMGSDISPTVGYRGLYAPFTRKLLESANLITVKSAYMEQMLEQIGDFANKTKRITWGVDLNLYRPGRETKGLRNRLNISKDSLVIFDPRAMRPLYNKHILIDAFKLYQASGGQKAILVISGYNADLHYQDRLQRKIEFLKLKDTVIILPEQSPQEMAQLYTLADIVVSIPKSDGFPQSLYEAWACGKFMVLSDLPQYREEVSDGQTARLVPVGDVQGLANAMMWAGVHPEVRRRAKQIGREHVKLIANKAEQTRKMNQLYADLLAATPVLR